MTVVTPHDRVFLPLFVGLSLVAWGALVVWDLSPYARYLEHDWTRLGMVASLCAALPAGEMLVPAMLYVMGWLLMTAAMMLPTTLPFVTVFRRLTMRRTNAASLLAVLLAGYCVAWLGFGLAAHLFSLALIEIVRGSAWLTFNGWLIATLILLLAGLFQFSSLKYRCLDACRSPVGFMTARWRGHRPLIESFQLGLAHGIYCVGCCWALMLLMFVLGTGSIGWMLALGALMALEKNSPWGRRLARPLGCALMVSAGVIVVAELS
jgi:predicted metal-binding membrane protein